jgi:hypothetical protein
MIRYFWPSDDEQLAGQWVDSHMAEDADWWVGAQKAGATLALAVTLALTSASTAIATQVFSQSQDDPAGSLFSNPLVQEEYWQNPVPPVNWPQTAVFTDDDIHVQFVQVFTPDDGDWKNLVAPVQATNYIQLPLGIDDQTPQFAVVNAVTDDNESIWSPQIQPWEPNWTLLFFLDDGSTVPVFQYDEDFWVSGVAPYNWPQPAQPFQASDDDGFVQSFSGNDEGVWTPQVTAVADSLRLQQPWVWEQNEQVANLVAFTDEVYWQNPTPPVPDSIWLLRQDAFDSQDPVGNLTLILDDGFQPGWQPFVPTPDPGSLLLLQQWPFEQNEPAGSLYTLRDEDFWVNPVPPVNWTYPLLPNFDEVITTFTPFLQPDEDFGQQPVVAPVVAANIYNQPFGLLGQQEDDTPVLVPFVPPPPPFCPLPPKGPDGDVSISIFGGNQPTLALFCRICNSGKPLVVRADYAIWCQDCCAFVSKQDTYQGTVRGPGQFRSIF